MCECCDEIKSSMKNIIEMFSDFENKFDRKFNDKMTVMSNSFIYISKILEQGGIVKSGINKTTISWVRKMEDMMVELSDLSEKNSISHKMIKRSIFKRMRDIYGIVIDELKKDYKYKYELEFSPDPMDAIADNNTAKELFESILVGMFPKGYWNQGEDENNSEDVQSVEDLLRNMIKPLAELYHDTTNGYNKTFRIVYEKMGCSWNNLKTRYKNTNNLKISPRKITIVMNNPRLMNKFKKTIDKLIDENCKICYNEEE